MSAVPLRAPFPWPGGKSLVAAQIWTHLGSPRVYAEPFAGSLAVLLRRPGWHPAVDWVETINDADGFVANAWRAILHDPEGTAAQADWPVNEADLHARHAWLVRQREDLTARLMGDPEFFDARIAGWWLWGIACWISSGFCSGAGPWASADGRLVHLGTAGRGVSRQLVYLRSAGHGVNRQLVHLGNAGQGVNRQEVHRGRAGLVAWLAALALRLRRVRVAVGDWERVVTPVALGNGGLGACAVFLDPPYAESAVYGTPPVADRVRAWCLTAPPAWRIALCGLAGEHRALEALGWSRVLWAPAKGYQAEARAEAIWFSPACATVARQGALFDEAAGEA